MGTGKFAEYVLTLRKKDGAALVISSNYPPKELEETETTIDIMLTEQEFRLIDAAKSLKNAINIVDSIKWKIKYWGKIEMEEPKNG